MGDASVLDLTRLYNLALQRYQFLHLYHTQLKA